MDGCLVRVLLRGKVDDWESEDIWTGVEEVSENCESTEDISKYEGGEEDKGMDEEYNGKMFSNNLTFLEWESVLWLNPLLCMPFNHKGIPWKCKKLTWAWIYPLLVN